jgi:hypothetical protein
MKPILRVVQLLAAAIVSQWQDFDAVHERVLHPGEHDATVLLRLVLRHDRLAVPELGVDNAACLPEVAQEVASPATLAPGLAVLRVPVALNL